MTLAGTPFISPCTVKSPKHVDRRNLDTFHALFGFPEFSSDCNEAGGRGISRRGPSSRIGCWAAWKRRGRFRGAIRGWKLCGLHGLGDVVWEELGHGGLCED